MSARSLPMRKRGAFTLVELLVVIGIIAVLIAILLPALKKVNEQANAVACMAQQKQIMTAVMMYTAENKGAFPLAPQIGEFYTGAANAGVLGSLAFYMSNSAPAGAGVIRYDVGSLFPYLVPKSTRNAAAAEKPGSDTLKKLFSCPTDKSDVFRPVIWGGIRTDASIVRNFSYSFNSQTRNDQAGSGGTIHLSTDPNPDICRKASQVKQASHKILLIEEKAPNDGLAWIMLNDPDDEPAFRHNGSGVFGFCDGHVDRVNQRDMGFGRVASLNNSAGITDMNKCRYYFKMNKEN